MNNKKIIEKVNKWQNADWLHPLTCGNNSNHKILQPIEKNNKIILKCLDCNYEQEYIPSVILRMDIYENI